MKIVLERTEPEEVKISKDNVREALKTEIELGFDNIPLKAELAVVLGRTVSQDLREHYLTFGQEQHAEYYFEIVYSIVLTVINATDIVNTCIKDP